LISNSKKRKIVILGSTGSIGTQALDCIQEYFSDDIEIEGLSTNNNIALLKKQSLISKPRYVCSVNKRINKSEKYFADLDVKVFSGTDGLNRLVTSANSDSVLIAIIGISGLEPTIAAIKSEKNVLMANKESIVSAGDLINNLLDKHNSRLIPIDSEHSAIFQCISGRSVNEIKRIILTASGGPFLKRKRLNNITPEQALLHPRWSMGPKVSVDSANLMNKGLEIIEASKLFKINHSRIDILIHPQSIVHCLIEFVDGTFIANIAPTDMTIPISYALSYPERKSLYGMKSLSVKDFNELIFEEVDYNKYPCLVLSREAIKIGGLAPCILSAADEIAVDAFLKRKISFTQIPLIIENTISDMDGFLSTSPDTVSVILEADRLARKSAVKNIKRLSQQ